MDVNPQNFAYFLPGILHDLAGCCFVALDLEFSGINPNSPLPHRTHGTQSLQARYTEVKDAAEKYQVVQIGLTVCHEDVETGEVHDPLSLHEESILKHNRNIRLEAVQYIP